LDIELVDNNHKLEDKKLSLLERHDILIQKQQKLENENLILVKQNKQLTSKLSLIQSLFDEATSDLNVNTILKEKGHVAASKVLDIRKSTLQQSQIIQLKRHLASFTDESDKYDMIIATSHSEISQIKAKLKELVEPKTLKDEHYNKCINSTIKKLDSLSRNIDRGIKDVTKTKNDRITPTFEFISEFIHPQRSRNLKPVNLADVMNGDIGHLNLRHVSRLEQQLALLYGGLI
jgi:hypothetical protein